MDKHLNVLLIRLKKIWVSREFIDTMIDSERVIVNFVICGTQKGGTTALDTYLRGHPEVCMANTGGKAVSEAENKEVHFFDNEEFFNTKRTDYSIYHAAFHALPEHKVLGETTPIYMYWYEAPKRIYQYNPDMKLIVVLRNPIERAFSHWNMERSRGADELNFWDALMSEGVRCREALPSKHRVYSYVDRGHYLEQLRRLWTYFPKDKVLVLKNEELRYRLHETLDMVAKFLRIDPEYFKSLQPKQVHSRPYLSRIADREKEYLRSIFHHEILELERVLGWDCSRWLQDE